MIIPTKKLLKNSFDFYGNKNWNSFLEKTKYVILLRSEYFHFRTASKFLKLNTKIFQLKAQHIHELRMKNSPHAKRYGLVFY